MNLNGTYNEGYRVGVGWCRDWPYWKLQTTLDMFLRLALPAYQSDMSWGIADAIADRILEQTPKLQTLLAPWC
jgi:hypothetical protein